MTDYLMQPAAMVRKQRGRQTSEATIVRRKQLQENPNQWFVWQENATYRTPYAPIHARLNGWKSKQNRSVKESQYEVSVQKNSDNTFNVYVRYVGQAQTQVREFGVADVTNAIFGKKVL